MSHTDTLTHPQHRAPDAHQFAAAPAGAIFTDYGLQPTRYIIANSQQLTLILNTAEEAYFSAK